MHRLFAVMLACACLAACTTTNTKVAFNNPAKPPAGARVLLLQPDIELSVLTAAGLQEPRADWSTTARDNLSADIEAAMKSRAHAFKTVDPNAAMSGRNGQLLRLHGAVGNSILMFNYGVYALPTKKLFDWTLGPGAQALAESQDADYALFVTGRGSYASGGRVATAIGLSLLGVGVPLGGQTVFASLVDLRTGQVVWFNVATAGPSADMREDKGSDLLVASLLKDLPL